MVMVILPRHFVNEALTNTEWKGGSVVGGLGAGRAGAGHPRSAGALGRGDCSWEATWKKQVNF